MERKSIHMTHAALNEWSDGTIILRGVIAPSDLRHLMVDDYQREALPISSLKSMMETVKSGGTLPDIVLGMRGQHHTSKGDQFALQDAVYIIDGQQRVNACINILDRFPDSQVHLGAMLHFDTTKEWEKARFHVLNTRRAKVSPGILLRNLCDENDGIASLYTLSQREQSFALKGRVSWSQRMAKTDVVPALTLANTIAVLHSHKVAGRSSGSMDLILSSLNRQLVLFGAKNFEANVIAFFDLIDHCWGLRRIQYREFSPQLKGSFLWTLARFLSDHVNFWRGPDQKQLFIDMDTQRKLAKFPLRDDGVKQLASSTGPSAEILYQMIINHVNAGRRTNRMKSRKPEEVFEETPKAEVSAA